MMQRLFCRKLARLCLQMAVSQGHGPGLQGGHRSDLVLLAAAGVVERMGRQSLPQVRPRPFFRRALACPHPAPSNCRNALRRQCIKS